MKFTILFSFFLCTINMNMALGQIKIPDHYHQDNSFNDALKNIINATGLHGSYDAGEDGMEEISFAVIDLTGEIPVFGGVNAENFIYPASVYKIYVAMEILKQISNGNYSLYQDYVIRSPNTVDKAKEINYDPRPLLEDGDTVNVNYLLDLMLTRSDNSAANALIDIAGRRNTNTTMHKNGWFGSDVTRKFLNRAYEDPGYKTIRGTETCALHAADFMYKVYNNELINPWVSRQMKSFLGRQLDTSKLATGLPKNTMFYHKTGWWSYYTNDVGIVEDGQVKYIIALFTPVREEEVRSKMTEVSRRIYTLIKSRQE